MRAYLIAKGVGGDRITARGYGETKPAAAIDGLKRSKLKAARAKNRRVEFKLITGADAPAEAPKAEPTPAPAPDAAPAEKK